MATSSLRLLKLGLGAVLLNFSYHSDSKMGHVINYLLTGPSYLFIYIPHN